MVLGVTRDSILKASGQVDIDTDHMVKDDKTRELKHILAVLNDLCPEQLGAKNEYDIVETITRNPLFETQLDANSELVIFYLYDLSSFQICCVCLTRIATYS